MTVRISERVRPDALCMKPSNPQQVSWNIFCRDIESVPTGTDIGDPAQSRITFTPEIYRWSRLLDRFRILAAWFKLIEFARIA